jgi:hypothetical protein
MEKNELEKRLEVMNDIIRKKYESLCDAIGCTISKKLAAFDELPDWMKDEKACEAAKLCKRAPWIIDLLDYIGYSVMYNTPSPEHWNENIQVIKTKYPQGVCTRLYNKVVNGTFEDAIKIFEEDFDEILLKFAFNNYDMKEPFERCKVNGIRIQFNFAKELIEHGIDEQNF